MSEQNDLDAPFDEWGDTLPSRRPRVSEIPRACEYCGQSCIEPQRIIPVHDTVGWVARCGHCQAQGPMKDTPEEAIAAWNQRAGETTGFDAWYQAILSHAEESCAGCPLDGRCKNLKAVGMPCEIAPQMHKIETALRQLYDERGRG